MNILDYNNCNTSTMVIVKKDGTLKLHPCACHDDLCPSYTSSVLNIMKETINYVTLTFHMNHFACLTANPQDPDGILELAKKVEHDLFCLNEEGYKNDCLRRRVKYDPRRYESYCENILHYDVEVQFNRYKNAIRHKCGYPKKIGKKEEVKLIEKFRGNSQEKLKHIQQLTYGWLFIRVGELQKNHRIHFHYICNGWMDGVIYQYVKEWKGISYDEKCGAENNNDIKSVVDYITKYVSKGFDSVETWKEYGIIHVSKGGKAAIKRVPQIGSSYIFTQSGAPCLIKEWKKALDLELRKTNAIRKKRFLTFAKEELGIKDLSEDGSQIYHVPSEIQQVMPVDVSKNYIIDGLLPQNPRKNFSTQDALKDVASQFATASKPTYISVENYLYEKYLTQRRKAQRWAENFFSSPAGKQLNREVHNGKITKKAFAQELEKSQKESGLPTIMELREELNEKLKSVGAVASEYALQKYKSAPKLKKKSDSAGYKLTAEQENFIETVGDNPITLLNGAAGTGKTSVVAAMISSYSYPGMKILLTSVSSKAVMILEEALSHIPDPLNIELTFENTCVAMASVVNKFYFGYIHPQSSLEYDMIIVDEVSMMSIQQLCALLTCAKPGTRFVFCGDFKQLQPVGSNFSAIFFLNEMKLPVCSLTKNMRSMPEVSMLADAIRQSSLNLEKEIQKRTEPMENLNWLIRDGYQVITNTHSEINSIINHLGKRTDFTSDGVLFSMNDQCLAAKNISKYGILNGTEMTLIGYKQRYHRAVFMLDSGKQIELPINDGLFLPLAARTVHKSQGNEFDKVAIVIQCRNIAMCNKNWLYTAVTRAKSDVKVLFDFTDYKGHDDPVSIIAQAKFTESAHYSDVKLKGIKTILLALLAGCHGDDIKECKDFKEFIGLQLKKQDPRLFAYWVNTDPDLDELNEMGKADITNVILLPPPQDNQCNQLTFWVKAPDLTMKYGK